LFSFYSRLTAKTYNWTSTMLYVPPNAFRWLQIYSKSTFVLS